MMTEIFNYVIVSFMIVSCSQKQNTFSGKEILEQSISTHDPNTQWENSILNIHIQEPRIQNPSRYSKVKLDHRTNSFELIRNRDTYESKHIIDVQGNAKVYLNDSEDIDSLLVKKYRLTPGRNEVYRKFYSMLYRLPMSLNEEAIHQIGSVELVKYNGHNCYKIPIELKETLFSKHWVVYIATSSYTFKGMEIIFPEDPTKGERLYFEGSIVINSMNIPRIRHWHELTNNAYLGSDIIVKELEN